MGCAAEAPFGLGQFKAINRPERTFLVAPNSFATETNRAESAFCAAVACLRFHGRALFARHVPIPSLLHNVGKHAKLNGGEGRIRTLGATSASMRRIRPEFGPLFGPKQASAQKRICSPQIRRRLRSLRFAWIARVTLGIF